MNDDLKRKLHEATWCTVRRKWSPVKTAECPIEDLLSGGWVESDEQLRKRLVTPSE